mmetsp:Transcript_102750/g.329473  ORF Transcript_102750/g.329473 Transcript_102750/m.329473 type:complete len:406 (+) Transcript_102750:34-1251(+)
MLLCKQKDTNPSYRVRFAPSSISKPGVWNWRLPALLRHLRGSQQSLRAAQAHGRCRLRGLRTQQLLRAAQAHRRCRLRDDRGLPSSGRRPGARGLQRLSKRALRRDTANSHSPHSGAPCGGLQRKGEASSAGSCLRRPRASRPGGSGKSGKSGGGGGRAAVRRHEPLGAAARLANWSNAHAAARRHACPGLNVGPGLDDPHLWSSHVGGSKGDDRRLHRRSHRGGGKAGGSGGAPGPHPVRRRLARRGARRAGGRRRARRPRPVGRLRGLHTRRHEERAGVHLGGPPLAPVLHDDLLHHALAARAQPLRRGGPLRRSRAGRAPPPRACRRRAAGLARGWRELGAGRFLLELLAHLEEALELLVLGPILLLVVVDLEACEARAMPVLEDVDRVNVPPRGTVLLHDP